MRTLDHVIADANLPAPIAQTIRRIAARTRLRASERADVARELCAHFADGLAQGQSPEALLSAFGEPDAAARLIRAAVRRKRPARDRFLSLTLRAAGFLLLALLGAYAILFIRYRFAQPSIARNYTREINTRIEAAAIADRAWPLYEKLFAAWIPMADRQAAKSFPPGTPADPIWDQSRQFIRANAANLELLRAAAAKPALGLTLDFKANPILRDFSARNGNPPSPELIPENSVDRNPPLLEVRLPHLGPMREMARALAFDLSLAAEENQPERALADALALLGMANQLREHRFLICDLVSLAILSTATDRVAATLASHPDLFSPEHLRDLSHALAAFPTDQGPLIRFDGERAFFQDTLQRMFTDNGKGDGRFASEGYNAYLQLVNSSANSSSSLAEDLVGPLMSVALAPRAEQSRVYESLLAEAESQAAMPPWLRTIDLNAQVDRVVGATKLAQLRFLPVATLAPALNRSISAGSMMSQSRDALLVAIALELHRRQHHAYPQTLDALTPALLPAIPRDMYDGGPIKYLLREGKPVLYSVGVDRIDNRGEPPPDDTSPSRASQWMTPDQLAAWRAKFIATPAHQRPADLQGDWTLFPKPN